MACRSLNSRTLLVVNLQDIIDVVFQHCSVIQLSRSSEHLLSVQYMKVARDEGHVGASHDGRHCL